MSTEVKEKVKVTVKGILAMLEAGKDRAVIGEELGLSGADVKRMFQHPELKGRKVKKAVEVGFVFEEEPTMEMPEPEEEAVGSFEDMEKAEQEATWETTEA